MTARAIYKAKVELGTLEVPVRFYAAAEDQDVHFRLLHSTDGQPVTQQYIDKTTERPVERASIRKALPVSDQRLVMFRPEELAALEPPPSRIVAIRRCLPFGKIPPAFYERPYYLGPDGDLAAYFALARALQQRKCEGLARWVMRKRMYVGALSERDGYLVLVTLRHAEQVVDISAFKSKGSKSLNPQELRLARQLVQALESDFDPAAYHDDYRERVEALVERKASGQVIAFRPPRKATREPGLAAALESSLKSVRRKSA